MSSASPELDLLGSIERGEAPRQILEFAARGFVPLPPAELVRAVSTIVATGDWELAGIAEETFRGFEANVLKDAVASPEVRSEQLEIIARRTSDQDVLEHLIRHRAVSNDTLAWLAERVGPWLQDVLITNQIRLLAAPNIVERLFENPQLSTDIKRRADEFLEEFFLKKLREEAATAQLAAEAEAEAEARALAAEAERASAADASQASAEGVEGEGETEEINLQKLSTLSVVQRIRIAYLGNREERLYLVRDMNRLVSMAVLKSPKTREGDAETIANMKNVSEEVLRAIGMRREWTRRYSVAVALVRNPRSPLEITLPLLPRLSPKDMRLLAKDRNIPEAVRANARRVASRYDQ